MRSHKILIISCFFLCICYSAIAQTTIIKFEEAPIFRDNPHYFDNSGCGGYNRFGPNPTPLNGYNIRTVGNTLISAPGVRYPALNLYAVGNAKNTTGRDNNDYSNSNLSVEYPFKANKTYQIELVGIKDDQIWIDGTTRPSNYINPVLWVRLDNNPEISNTAQNKCIESYSPVEKKVERYSRLIADGNKNIAVRNYIVKFSLLENRNALKITYDPSPADPDFHFDGIFRLNNIKITELPYEEVVPPIPYYDNVPVAVSGPNSRNNNPLYKIEYNFPIPTRPGGDRSETPSITTNFTIQPYQWNTTNGESSYIISNLNIGNLSNCTALGAMVNSGRTQGRERFNLPTTFKNNNLTYEVIDGDLIIKSKNSDGTPPSIDIDFSILYTAKKQPAL